MSNSRLQSPAKSDNSGSTIGFKFHANLEELEELQNEDTSSDIRKEMNLTLNTALLANESLKKSEDKSEAIPDAVKDQWNILGKRSTSVDSTYESPFSNPIETWRKLNVLKEKLTKTVEEKISEMKIERNRARLISSKENSSVSDSEENSESSKVSEPLKDTEELNSSSTKQLSDSLNVSASTLENALLESVKNKMENKESESELRKRKNLSASELKLGDIKIATAKSEVENSLLEETPEDVESGVEADENMDSMESDSIDFFDDPLTRSTSGGSSPPGGNYVDYKKLIKYFSSFVPTQTFSAVALIVFILYFIIPTCDFIRGFILCFLLMRFWELLKGYVQDDEAPFTSNRPFSFPDLKSLPPLKVPQSKPVKGIWVNEYEKEFYDPDYYSVTQTIPAYLELDNSILKLSRPKGKINKRATFDEPDYKLHFISQRVYDISGCSIYLMPDGLTRKRLFSKKYPIVIFLKPESLISEKVKGKEGEIQEDVLQNAFPTSLQSPKSKSSLYLFARCDRQKEEWYRRLLAASRLPSTPSYSKNDKIPESPEDVEDLDDSPARKDSSTPFETLFFDDDMAVTEEYLRYMAKFVYEDVMPRSSQEMKRRCSWNRKLKSKKKDAQNQDDDVEMSSTRTFAVHTMLKKAKSSRISVEPEGNEENEQTAGESENFPSLQVQWFNAFINRILFDVFRSPYWLNKIHDKIQKKLNSFRLPYYIEDIEVVELDLGKTGPVFHRVSAPYIDERGLWFDMDTTFDGLFRLTIQTHLNLIKLQKGMEEQYAESHPNDKTEKDKETKKEGDIKDSFVPKDSKDSKEKSKHHVERKNRKLEKECSKPCALLDMDREKGPEVPTPTSSKMSDNADLEPKKFDTCNLIHEVTQFAEMAVEENLNRTSQRSAIYDSDLEDSAESSEEDDEEEEDVQQSMQSSSDKEEPQPQSTARRYPKNRRSSKGIFRVFENVAQSKYFKSMAQSKYVKKAIAGVSAAKLRLTLEVKSCRGTLTVNIPPPPSDRFWYGFREMPKLVFSANPKIGDKSLRFIQIKNYLQKKILDEMKKVMVAPNMIDFVLPTTSPGRSSSSLQIEQPDISEQEATPPE